MTIPKRDLADVVEALKSVQNYGRGCALLVGAGCSVKAGIPLASGFVDIIQTQSPRAYNRAKTKQYPTCMAELSVSERRSLIAHYVDLAKINWAHICVAQLMKHGFVDRVLTTNFDMLIARACAIVGEFPAIYDFATSQLFKSADIPDKAVFYLHGQRTGFALMNTKDEVNTHANRLRPVFDDAGRGRAWIVVGYSGNNDPVFDHLANVTRFDDQLFWVGYRDETPGEHVCEKLLCEGKDAFLVSGYDADDFFVKLCSQLGCFPPEFVSQPFTHLRNLLEMLIPFTIPGENADFDVTVETREWIRDAIERHEFSSPAPSEKFVEQQVVDVVAAHKALMSGDYERVIAMHEASRTELPPEGVKPVCWAYIMRGHAFVELAKNTAGESADPFFTLAFDSFNAALKIDPQRYEALNSWGTAYYDQAQRKPKGEAKKLFVLAAQKHELARAMNPNDPWTLNNLGNALAGQSNTCDDDESNRLFETGIQQYRTALGLDPRKHEILNSWGSALLGRAANQPREQAVESLTQAAEKFQASLHINPDDHWALNNLATALLLLSQSNEGEQADQLFAQALAMYEAAVRKSAEKHYSLHNWGNALVSQAKRKEGEEADRLFALAEGIYAAALEAKPDYHWVLNSWGYALFDRAMGKSGTQAESLFAQAGEKYHAALQINSHDHWTLHNWGWVLSNEAMFKQPAEAERLFSLATEKFEAAVTICPTDSWAWLLWGKSLVLHATSADPARACVLVIDAKAKFQRANSIHPGCCDEELRRMEDPSSEQGESAFVE